MKVTTTEDMGYSSACFVSTDYLQQTGLAARGLPGGRVNCAQGPPSTANAFLSSRGNTIVRLLEGQLSTCQMFKSDWILGWSKPLQRMGCSFEPLGWNPQAVCLCTIVLIVWVWAVELWFQSRGKYFKLLVNPLVSLPHHGARYLDKGDPVQGIDLFQRRGWWRIFFRNSELLARQLVSALLKIFR